MNNTIINTITELENQISELNILNITRDYTDGARKETEDTLKQLQTLLGLAKIHLTPFTPSK